MYIYIPIYIISCGNRITLKNKCELKRFKVFAVYPKLRPFWIYITVSFFKTFFLLLVCVLKILSILKKKKIVG